MKVVDALKSDQHSIYLTNASKWMVFDQQFWIVYEKGYGKKKVKELYRGSDEEEAVRRLLQN